VGLVVVWWVWWSVGGVVVGSGGPSGGSGGACCGGSGGTPSRDFVGCLGNGASGMGSTQVPALTPYKPSTSKEL
jgi:hypothetical protein